MLTIFTDEACVDVNVSEIFIILINLLLNNYNRCQDYYMSNQRKMYTFSVAETFSFSNAGARNDWSRYMT